jgi:hypothetical protein
MQAAGVVQVFKRGRARKHGEAVTITLKVLTDLDRHTLPAAAKTLGLSATALKGACRKLGITRWPYWAGRGMVPALLQKRAPPALQDAATQTDVTVAGVYACDVPALVDAEAAFDAREDDVHAWWH